MTALLVVLHAAALVGLPFLLVGIVNRTKALWAGRKGPRLLQAFSDFRRLLGKRPVYSEVTTEIFRLGPLVVLASTLVSALMMPVLGGFAPISFPYDFVAVAYLWGLGRVFTILAALDTGSSFEGMGASREATYAALVEPALFLALGTLAAATGHGTFAELVGLGVRGPAQAVVTAGCAVAFFIVLQVEAARVPVDDPTTHLELTMIHEVMVLDHSGPDLAAIQYAAALKMMLCASVIASLLNPLRPADGVLLVAAVNLALTALVAVGVGFVESLVARLRLRTVPAYVLVATVSALVALLTTAWWQGSPG
ncbi:respiratory chain complex I subunit 1 family protein [Anaeromyxobacter oryzae]|uniref:Hydrogenase n=1 Tax=Anaeromyxobacter oryzae TaxID=2918170 RepID=A0ABM7WSX2_9BACT|nr:NADH-quinone oxidoreductase subunit H [Anaeromyxobacter oryzae]BDG02563.1 hydrogenase [Anaeromyxobacter oryzae]